MKYIFKWFSWTLLVGGMFLVFLDFTMFGTLAAMSDQVASGISEFVAGTWGNSGCTHTIGYWKNHPEDWPVDGITIGGLTYPITEALLLFKVHHQGDATYLLVYQLTAAKLNILNGADPIFLEEAIEDADDWLVINPLGSYPQNPGREDGIALAETLEMYNSGEIGPGICPEDGRRIVSSSEFYDFGDGDPSLEPGPPRLDFSATPIGMLPELTGTPITIHTPDRPEKSPSFSGSEPPTTPQPTQTVAPKVSDVYTPTPAPTMDVFAELTLTPFKEGSPTPTIEPTVEQSPTATVVPSDDLAPTTTIKPTAYAGPPGCTHPMQFWTSNLDIWPLDEFTLAEDIYDQDGAMAILLASPEGDATYILAQQFITTQLNIASPADPSAVIDILKEVQIWFFKNPIGSAPKNPDRKEGLELAAGLEAYNLGIQGPGPCEVELSTATSTPTSTKQATPTHAPTMASALIPSPTPTTNIEITPTASIP